MSEKTTAEKVSELPDIFICNNGLVGTLGKRTSWVMVYFGKPEDCPYLENNDGLCHRSPNPPKCDACPVEIKAIAPPSGER